MELSTLFFFMITLALGIGLGGAAFYVFRNKTRDQLNTNREVTVLLERIEKVFKVVMAEGYFTEIYNYQNDKRLWQLFKDKKKALIISKAKVLVGYDFGKMKFRVDENSRRLVVEYFPEPEVLSMDTDYKFYDIEQGWINRFQSDDYTNILTEAKQAMNEKALQSDLPRIATNQLQFMMIQLAAGMSWKIDLQQLPESNKKNLNALTDYKEVNAIVRTLPSTISRTDRENPEKNHQP